MREAAIEIQLFGTLRLAAGRRAVPLALPDGATLREALAELLRCYPAFQPLLLDDQGGLRSDLPLFVNGRNPRLRPESFDQPLQPGDQVSLFSPVSSGRINVEVLRQAEARNREED